MIRRRPYHYLAASLLSLVGGLALPVAVLAQSGELSGESLETIRRHCSSAQLTLQQVQKRDAVSRINRGRAYDLMLKQIAALNSRFAYNKISLPETVQLASDLQTHVNQFRTNYDRYDNDLDAAIHLDCKEKPAEFYSWIVKARDDRAAVSAEISQIESVTGRYREAVVNYQESLNKPEDDS